MAGFSQSDSLLLPQREDVQTYTLNIDIIPLILQNKTTIQESCLRLWSDG